MGKGGVLLNGFFTGFDLTAGVWCAWTGNVWGAFLFGFAGGACLIGGIAGVMEGRP